MKTVFIKGMSLICVVFILISGFCISASAATASAAVSASPNSVDIGAEFTVTIKVSSTTIGSVEGELSYNSSVVEFVSGSGAAGASGLLRLSKWAEGSVSSLSFTLKFKGKAAGSSAITFKATEVTDYDMQALNNPTASANVTVKSPQVLSSNANLTSLRVTSGTLSPAFSKNTLNYSVTVDNSVTDFPIYADTEDKGAKVNISGSRTLKVGKNTRKVTVTAPSGATKTYTVTITRLAAESGTTSVPPVSSESVPPTTVEPEKINVHIGDKLMEVVEIFGDIQIPEGFSVDVTTYNNNSIACVKNDAGIVMLYLQSEAESGFYIYDSENISFEKYKTIALGGKNYIVLTKPRNVAVPSGFSSTELTVGEYTIDAWKHSDKEFKDFYLVYLCGQHGYAGLYMYDSIEDTVQRYISFAQSEVNANTAIEEDEPKWYEHYALYIAIGLAALIVIIITVIILIILNERKRSNKDMHDSNDDDDIFEQLSEIDFNFDTIAQENDVDNLPSDTISDIDE